MTNSSSDTAPKRLSEFAMIAKLFAPLAAKAEGAYGLTDDAATLRLPGSEELVVTVDALVEGVHFFRDDPPDMIARKALRVNLSDLAAKGAIPRGYLLALSLPDWIDDGWLTHFAGGLCDDQKTYGVDLLGGDTTSTPGPLTLSITALGAVSQGCMIRRGGAHIGDRVFVSGTIGDAGAGLEVLKGGGEGIATQDREYLISRYRLPEPRLTLGRRLAGLASAAADVSDGLVADLGHIAETSHVRIVVDIDRIPLSCALTSLWGYHRDRTIRAATAGDDYEIAFTAPQKACAAILTAAEEAGVSVHEIGCVQDGEGIILADAKGQSIPLAKTGFTHF